MIRNDKIIRNKLLLFILNPFILAITSLKDIRDGVSHKFLYAWFLIFGIGFCAISEAADSFRYVEEFMIEHNYTWSQYMMEINEYFTFESNIKDIYTLTVNFFVGRFTNNYHWTYFIYAAVFGFFYIKSLKIFLRYNNVSNNIVFYALLFMFCYSNPIYNINGVRFWTAAWIGVYVALSVFVDKNYKKLPLLILLPLVHGTSVIWVAIMAIALLLNRFQTITIGLFIVSSFVSAVSYLNILNDYSYLLPQFLQNQIWSYTESEMAQGRLSGISEYGKAYADFLIALPGYFQILLSYLLILNRKEINRDKRAGHVLTIMLALAAITNFLSGVPSMGRFKALVTPMLVIVWAYNYRSLKKYDKYFNVVPFIYAYSLLYWCRRMSAISELYLYIFPAPLTVIKYLFL
ncbi:MULTISPECIES: EpsG family protein [unclassified Bacteroides]|uniref:EpsG family protein n=1 Tax=unclassified Bacteroides TaxID=2646097 RepID=UPI0021652749|nr:MULTISPECIES: EpsG family protein [unclassified Bacteroides]MCS2337082.1 EpsG family protein [Bacteroides sp. BFG-606]